MPRWRALPDELDPQVREFAEQLRRLVDRSGLNIAALADRTGYSKTSWERYLNGRLLAPKGAVVALAEVTGTSPVQLTTLWELAERAWSRSELRHDMTMQAIRVSTERAAGTATASPVNPRGAAARPGAAGQAGAAPTAPPPAPAAAPAPGEGVAGNRGGSGSGNSWGLAGYRGPSRTAPRPAPDTAAPETAGPSDRPGPAAPPVPPPARAPRPDAAPGGAGGSGGLGGPAGRRRLVMFTAGLVGVLVVVAVALFLTRDDGKGEAAPKPKPSVTATHKLPPGVKCAGSGCTGKDAEAMGCAKDTTTVTTVKSATVGTTLVEVRYSSVCGAAWGRITSASQGDRVTLTAGSKKVSDDITTAGDTIAYTPMVAAKDGTSAKACVTLATGQQGCTP